MYDRSASVSMERSFFIGVTVAGMMPSSSSVGTSGSSEDSALMLHRTCERRTTRQYDPPHEHADQLVGSLPFADGQGEPVRGVPERNQKSVSGDVP